MNKPKVILTVDVEALPIRAASEHVNTLIYGRVEDREYGIGRMMDIADKHNIKMTFFVDFAECQLYGDEILEVGRYIVSRGHDMQVHCHYDLLEKELGKPARVDGKWDYYSWYKNDGDAKKIVNYVTDKYYECTGSKPLAYRGGEYRFGVSLLKMLKEKGYTADLSLNCCRPDVLSEHTQFMYENGLLEFPIGILPDKRPLNFNHRPMTPKTRADFTAVVREYKTQFQSYFDYYGQDSIATMLMHSWSFMYKAEHFDATGHIDTPNDVMVDFFDYFIGAMKDEVECVSVSDAVHSIDKEQLKMVDFDAVFAGYKFAYRDNLLRMHDYINAKIGKRRLIVWGTGIIEGMAFGMVEFHKHPRMEFYISKSADQRPVWRNKAVYKFSDVTLSPETDYVFVVAQPNHTDMREALIKLGFREFEDYFDIQKAVPLTNKEVIRKETPYTCSICGGHMFETFNSPALRRCSECGSVERSRTIPKLFEENVKFDFANTQILHVSPSKPERKWFRDVGADVTTIDIRPECKTDIVADICNMPEVASESFDMVFANCVLNHVYDDEKALSEMKRVLRPNGVALFWVLDSGSLKTSTEKDPTSWYGKDNYDKYMIGTFRHYGEVDFTEQLRRHFSKVQCFEKYDEVTDSSCKWYQCTK